MLLLEEALKPSSPDEADDDVGCMAFHNRFKTTAEASRRIREHMEERQLSVYEFYQVVPLALWIADENGRHLHG
jgi:hypothetical protein